MKIPNEIWLDPESQDQEIYGDDQWNGSYCWYASDTQFPEGVKFILYRSAEKQEGDSIYSANGYFWFQQLAHCLRTGAMTEPEIYAALRDILRLIANNETNDDHITKLEAFAYVVDSIADNYDPTP